MSPADLTLMRRIDELHLNKPFLGSRMLCDALNREGFTVGRKHVATLMARMGIEALCRKPGDHHLQRLSASIRSDANRGIRRIIDHGRSMARQIRIRSADGPSGCPLGG